MVTSNSAVTSTDASRTTACDTGMYCPQGTAATPLDCPPGTKRATTGASSIDECTECTAGEWCPSGSSAATDCAAGFYCPAETIWQYEYPCPAGYTTTAGANGASTDCTACADGTWCAEGISGSTSLCDSANYFCGSGAATPGSCSAGTYIDGSGTVSSAAGCADCLAGNFCQPGAPMTVCQEGYISVGTGNDVCEPVPEGYYASTDNLSAGENPAAGEWALEGATAVMDCPGGFSCASNTKTECAAGYYCPEGDATAPIAMPGGNYHNMTQLSELMPCAPGDVCADTDGAQPVKAAAGYYTLQGASTDTSTICAAGYKCPEGSIGPYQEGCPDGMESDGTNTYAGFPNCKTCEAGYYCYNGQKT